MGGLRKCNLFPKGGGVSFSDNLGRMAGGGEGPSKFCQYPTEFYEEMFFKNMDYCHSSSSLSVAGSP